MDIRDDLSETAARVPTLRADLLSLVELLDLNVGAALNKMRTVTERILHRLSTRSDVSWGAAEPTLERMVGPLVKHGVLPRNIALHVRTIQTNASPGSHFQESALDRRHLLIAASALAALADWFGDWERDNPLTRGPGDPADLRLMAVLGVHFRRGAVLSPTELDAQRVRHEAWVRASVEEAEGEVLVASEGKYRARLPAVHAAARAAERLRQTVLERRASGEDDESVILTVTTGDAVAAEDGLYGPSIERLQRIEARGAPDTVTLGEASWLALGGRDFEGHCVDPLADTADRIYRILPKRRVRRLHDQVMLLTDMVRYSRFVRRHEANVDLMDAVFTEWERIHFEAARFSGKVTFNSGDSFMVLFSTVENAVRFFEWLVVAWHDGAGHLEDLGQVRAAIQVGDLLHCGATLVGHTVSDCARALQRAKPATPEESVVALTRRAMEALSAEEREHLDEVEVAPGDHGLGTRIWVLRR